MKERDPGAWAVLLLPVLGLYLPLLAWIVRALGEEGRGETAWSSGLGTMLGVSFVIAGGGAVLAGVIGVVQAILLEAFPVRGRRVLAVLLLLPFLLPAAALTTAFHSLLARGPLSFLVEGVPGAVFLSGIQMAPVVLWGTSRAIAAIPRAEWDALRARFSPGEAARRVLFPRTKGTALRLSLLCFALLFPQLEIPGYTGLRPIGFRALSAFTSGSDLEGLLLVLISLAVVVPTVWLALPALTRLGGVPLLTTREWPAGRDRSGATEILWLLVILYLMPGLKLLESVGAVGWDVHRVHLGGLGVELLRTLCVAAIVSVLGWRLAQLRSPFAWGAFALPLLLPGSLPALAIAAGVPAEWLRAVGDAPVALSLSQAVRFAGLALVFGHVALSSVPAAELQAAQQVSPRARRWRILLPRCRATLVVATLFLALLMIGEVESANLLAPPGYVIPALELHNFLHFRYDENAWALALLLCLAGSGMALLATLLTESRRSVRGPS